MSLPSLNSFHQSSIMHSLNAVDAVPSPLLLARLVDVLKPLPL